MKTTSLTQKDTVINTDVFYRCDECGHQTKKLIPVQWAVGSTGHVGVNCCGHLFENEATVSADGLALGHWYIIPG